MKKVSYGYMKNKNKQMKTANNTLSAIPISGLIYSMNNLIEVLQSRGKEIRDFDNKKKVVKKVQLVAGKLFFMADESEEDFLDQNEHLKESNKELSDLVYKLRKENAELRKQIIMKSEDKNGGSADGCS